MLIYDLSEIQSRKPNPQVHLISKFLFNDGGGAQHTIPITIEGKPYVVFVDETGPGGFGGVANLQASCDAGLPVFPMARIIDISDEKTPKLVSRLMLETHDPANCSKVLPDLAGLAIFFYGSHYCSVDKDKATTLPVATSTPAFASSTSAIRCTRRKSRTTTRRARQRRAPAPIMSRRGSGARVGPTGARRRCTSTPKVAPCGPRARTTGS